MRTVAYYIPPLQVVVTFKNADQKYHRYEKKTAWFNNSYVCKPGSHKNINLLKTNEIQRPA